MQFKQPIAIALMISTIAIAFSSASWATPKQFRAGYQAGMAIGTKTGRMDGSGKAGTNSMHTNASCSIEQPRNPDFDRGYTSACRTAYERTFEAAYKNRSPKKSSTIKNPASQN